MTIDTSRIDPDGETIEGEVECVDLNEPYVKAFGGKDANGLPHISSQNSPLSSYKNYPLDYENPNGSGRITIK